VALAPTEGGNNERPFDADGWAERLTKLAYVDSLVSKRG